MQMSCGCLYQNLNFHPFGTMNHYLNQICCTTENTNTKHQCRNMVTRNTGESLKTHRKITSLVCVWGEYLVFCVCVNSHRCAGGELDPSAGSCKMGPGGLGSQRSCEEQSLSWFCVGGRGGQEERDIMQIVRKPWTRRGFLRARRSVNHSAFCSASTQASFICSLTTRLDTCTPSQH